MSEDTKESVKQEPVKRVSNEQIMSTLQELILDLVSIKADVEEIKKRTGFRDTPVEAISKKNWNTDKGPWPIPGGVKK